MNLLQNAIQYSEREQPIAIHAFEYGQQVRCTVADRGIGIHENELEFTSRRAITATLVRFLVEKGFDVIGVNQKNYGLDDIYQKYFESNSTKNTSYEKSIS